MKKLVLVILILLLTGCGEKEKIEAEIIFNDDIYQTFLPYKESVGENYVVDNKTTRYDLLEVDEILTDLSTNYFAPNNSYYQEGQYLTKETLKELLDDKHLNKSNSIEVNNKKYHHNYISYIYEQNYLSSNGNLKGISIALGLNPYLEYKNDNNITQYKELDENQVLNIGKQKALELQEYIKTIEELKDIKILFTLYLQPSPNSTDVGTFKYISLSPKSVNDFKALNYQDVYLTSTYCQNNDILTYNNYNTFIQKLKTNFDDLYISGKGIYIDNKLKDIIININTITKTNGELRALNQKISEEVINLFGSEPKVIVYTKNNQVIKSMMIKNRNSNKTNIYLMEE